jgi:hypothetical protein
MGIRSYFKECWIELWNPDNRTWQYVDRIFFLLLPIVALSVFIFNTLKLREWGEIMANLAWIIPFSIWLLFLLLVVPYRLANKYQYQRNELQGRLDTRDKYRNIVHKILEFYTAGDNLKTAIFKKHDDDEGSAKFYQEWITMVTDYFLANPHELGLAQLLNLKPENTDLNVPVPPKWSADDVSTGLYIILEVQLRKLKCIIQDLSRRIE